MFGRLLGMIKMQSLVVFSIVLVLLCQSLSLGQLNEGNLVNQRIEVDFTDATLIYVLDKLAVEHRIPIGLERASTETYGAKLNIHIKNGTLKDVFDSIVQQEPEYNWEVKDGVVNFTPINRYSFVEKLLNTPISSFKPKKGISKFQIRDSIVNISEVQKLLTSNNIGVERMDYPYHRSIYSNDEVDLSTSNTDVRGVLNKVVRVSEHKIWVVEMYGYDGNKLLISF
jgi:hypothetical protein